jgi:hypothetical protein
VQVGVVHCVFRSVKKTHSFPGSHENSSPPRFGEQYCSARILLGL